MLFVPRQTRFAKVHKLPTLGRTRGTLLFGKMGLIAKSGGYLSANQLEAARKVIAPHFKTQGKFWIRVFPHFPETQKPKEVRMGKGKGSVAYWYCPIRVNQILFEFTEIDFYLLFSLVRRVNSKLPFKVGYIKDVGSSQR
jgi:large subunit ribosomal protein L16